MKLRLKRGETTVDVEGQVKSKMMLILATILVATAVTGYVLFRQFEKDRESIRNFNGFNETRDIGTRETLPDGRTVTTYNEKDLAKARKDGKLPKGVEPNSAAQAAAANEASVQRTLRTIDEINKINEMNRRLQEQQQRQNR